MNNQSIMGIICSSYEQFFDAEKRIADYILENKKSVVDMTVAQLAKASGTSDATVSRFCRRCGYCAPCTVGIDIPNQFVFHGYLSRYGLADWAKARYGALSAHASDCVECGACEGRCPYQLPIREMLKKIAADFGF